jgi:N-methylhydantoinase A
MMMTDLRRDYFLTRLAPFDPHDESARQVVADAIAEIEGLARDQYLQEDIAADQVKFTRLAKMRYANQEHSVEVLLPDGTVTSELLDQAAREFHEQYEREYTYRLDAPLEFVGLHVIAVAEVGKLTPAILPVTGRTPEVARKSRREIDFALAGKHMSDIYDGDLLEPAMIFGGPAVIETAGSTVVVHPGDRVEIDSYGNLHIELSEGTKA